MKIDKGPMTVEGFAAYVESVQSCGDHPLPTLDVVLQADGVAEILDVYIEISESYDDTQGFVLTRLKDGTYGLFSEWSDSSGHG